jgi:hypothetical protein
MFNFYVREQGREDPWLFFEAKMDREQKHLGNSSIEHRLSDSHRENTNTSFYSPQIPHEHPSRRL